MIELFHISDLHFGKNKSRIKLIKYLLQCIEAKHDILKSPNKYLLITGDIVHDSVDAYYQDLINVFNEYKKKIILVPGNHEYSNGFPAGFFYRKQNAIEFDTVITDKLDLSYNFFKKKPIPIKLTDSTNASNEVLIIALNSCNEGDAFGCCGKIGKDQLNDLSIILKDETYKSIPKVVMLHHIADKLSNEFFMDLVDYKKLWKLIENQVQVVAYGHEGKMDKVQKKKFGKQEIGKTIEEIHNYRLQRKMEVKTYKDSKIQILDANDSVDDTACYWIQIDKIENNSVIKIEIESF